MEHIRGKIIQNEDVSDIQSECFVEDKLIAKPASYYQQFDRNKLLVFMHRNNIYVLPTWELCGFLKQHIVGKAIEICCGNGAIGRTLGIPFSDRKLHADFKIMRKFGLPPTNMHYPQDVEELTAHQALVKYQPNTVIGGYVMHKATKYSGSIYGVEEHKFFDKSVVKTHRVKYIHIGNTSVHDTKPINRLKHTVYRPEWLITRGDDSENLIQIWE
jgi:hypothetical protein